MATDARTVSSRPRKLSLFAAFAAALLASACVFDDSRLSERARCTVDEDCPGDGLCFDGYCFDELSGFVDVGQPDVLGPGDPLDVGRDSGGITPDTAPDATDDPGTDPDEDDPDGADDGRDDTGGDDAVIIDVIDESVTCTTTNACGGCAELSAEPGQPCEAQRCGIWECDTPDRLSCVAGQINICGGCDELDGAPGDMCGVCEGELQCDGDEALVCIGGAQNACGGCGGPEGNEGDACGCPELDLIEDHTLACADDRLVCEDDNGSFETATALPDANDTMSEATSVQGSLTGGDETDWFVVEVADEAAAGGMFPDIRLTGLSRDRDLCAFFLYADGGAPDIRCASGTEVSAGGVEGCCSTSEGAEDELVRIRNAAWWTDRLDTENGGGNDDAVVFISVTGDPVEGCEPYTLEYQF